MNLHHHPTRLDSMVIQVLPVFRTIASRFPVMQLVVAALGVASAVRGLIYKLVRVVPMPAVFHSHRSITKTVIKGVSVINSTITTQRVNINRKNPVCVMFKCFINSILLFTYREK